MTSELPAMPPLDEANDLLDNHDALWTKMKEDGCLFLRGVVDLDAVHATRRRFMDVLVDMGVADPGLPIWGKVLSFEPRAVKVRNHDGRDVTLGIDEGAYCRWTMGARIPVEDLIRRILPGDSILAFVDGDKAAMLRPPC